MIENDIIYILFIYLQHNYDIFVIETKEKNSMTNKYLKTIIFFSMFIIVDFAFAQGPPPPPPPFPVDGGLFALFAAGVLYGISKLRSKKK